MGASYVALALWSSTPMNTIHTRFSVTINELLGRVAKDYSLDSTGLVNKYGCVPASRPRGRRPGPLFDSLDMTLPLSEQVLKTLSIPTLKKVCRHFSLKVTGSRGDLLNRVCVYQVNPQDPMFTKKQHNRPRRNARIPEPVHDHAPDDGNHPDCPQCILYGNPLSRNFMDTNFTICICKDTTVPAVLVNTGVALVSSL